MRGAALPSADGSGYQFELSVPPDPAHLGAIRLFVASIARHFEVDEEIVDDLKVAVSEAAANSIDLLTATSDPVRVTARSGPGALIIEVEEGGGGLGAAAGAPKDVLEPPTEEVRRMLGLSVIQSLFPGAETTRSVKGGANIRFTIGIPD